MLTPGVRVQVPPRAPHFDLKSKDLGSFLLDLVTFEANSIFRGVSFSVDIWAISNIFLTLFHMGGRKGLRLFFDIAKSSCIVLIFSCKQYIIVLQHERR